jgi:3-hydroxyisobutyrate dehydrogenase
MNPRIGFVGVGRMGANMARRLKERGRTIAAVYDAQPDAAHALAKELGAQALETLAGLVGACDVIFTVISDDRAQLAIFSETGDSLLAQAEGKIFINCATLSPRVHREAQARAQRAGARAIEACMASSIPQARAGTLNLMCSGDRSAYDAVEPVLKQLSAQPRFLGEPGRAAEIKALVNMVMNIHTAALAEGLGLGAALGIDLNVLREVFAETGAASQVLRTDGEDMQNRSHDCYFSAAHAMKDSAIAWTLGSEAGRVLPLAAATKLQYERLVALGQGELDKSAVAELTFPGRKGDRP